MGGGKSGGTQVAAPVPMNTTTTIGNQLDAQTQELGEDDTIDREATIDRKKKGTRGLQIPLNSGESFTSSPSSSGVQI